LFFSSLFLFSSPFSSFLWLHSSSLPFNSDSFRLFIFLLFSTPSRRTDGTTGSSGKGTSAGKNTTEKKKKGGGERRMMMRRRRRVGCGRKIREREVKGGKGEGR
jgi:hypothetical protein